MDNDNKPTGPEALAKLPIELQAILKNAVEAGKFDQDSVYRIAGLATSDPEILSTIKDLVKSARVKPDLAEGKFHAAYIKQAAEKSWDGLSAYEKRDMKENAYPLYAAKHVEKYGKMPQELIMPKGGKY